jgi:hypothetical protein
LNFLGFQKSFEEKKYSLRSIRYLGEYTNEFITLDNRGLIPSLSKLINFGGKTKKPNLDAKMGSSSTSSTEEPE